MSPPVTPIDSLPENEENQDASTSADDTWPQGSASLWEKDKHDRDIQRRKQRGWLFWGIAGVSIVFYCVFLWHLVCPKTIYKLLCKSNYSLILFSLLGVIPTVLLLSLMNSVYRSTKEASGITGMAGEIAKLISAVAQLLTKK